MSLDPPAKRPIRGPYKRPNVGPHRRFVGTLTPIGRFHPMDDMIPLADLILQRIRNNRHLTAAGSFVLGDRKGFVYVLAEGSGTTAATVAKHMAWYVSSYAIGALAALPELEHIVDDLVAHYADMGVSLG